MNTNSYGEFYTNRPQYLSPQTTTLNMRLRSSGTILTSPPQTSTQTHYYYQQQQQQQQQQPTLPPPKLPPLMQSQQQQQYMQNTQQKQRRKQQQQSPSQMRPNNLSTNSITTLSFHLSPILNSGIGGGGGARSLTSMPSSQSSFPSIPPSVGTRSKKRSRRESISSATVSGSNSPIDTAAVRANRAARFAQWFVNWSSNREFCMEKRAAIVRRRSNASQPTLSSQGNVGRDVRQRVSLATTFERTQKMDMRNILGTWIHEKGKTTIAFVGKKSVGKHFLVNTFLQSTFLNSKTLIQNYQSWKWKFQQKKDTKMEVEEDFGNINNNNIISKNINGNKNGNENNNNGNTSVFQLSKRFASSINWEEEKAKLFQVDDDKSFLLPQGAKWLNNTAPHILRVKFGIITQAAIRFISQDRLRASIFAFLTSLRNLEDGDNNNRGSGSSGNNQKNANFYREFSLWRLKFIYKGKESLLAALPSATKESDIVFPDHIACLLSKEIKFQGSGKSADTDRIYVREQLKAIFAAWGPLIEEVEVRAPCSFLDRCELLVLDSDVPWDDGGCGCDGGSMQQRLADAVGDAGLLALVTGKDGVDDSLCSFVRATKFPQQYISTPDKKRAVVLRVGRSEDWGSTTNMTTTTNTTSGTNHHGHEATRVLEKIFAGLPCTDQMVGNIGDLSVFPREFKRLLQQESIQRRMSASLFRTLFWEAADTELYSTNIPLFIQMAWNSAIYSGCYDSIKSFSESWLRRANDFGTLTAGSARGALPYNRHHSSHGSIPSFTPLSPTLPATMSYDSQQQQQQQQLSAVRERSRSSIAYQSRRGPGVITPTVAASALANDPDSGVSPAHNLLFTLKMDQLSDSLKDDLRIDGSTAAAAAAAAARAGAFRGTTADERGRAITEKIHARAEQTKKALLGTPFVLENGGGNPSTFAEAVAEAKRNAETLWPGYRQAYFSSIETCRVILSPDFDGECLGADLKKLLCESLINFSLRIWNETVVRAFQRAEESYILLSNDAFRACSALLGGVICGEIDPYETIKLKQLLWQSQESAERIVFGLFERIYARMASVNMRQNCEISIRNICKQVIRTSLLPLFTPDMTLAQYHAVLQGSFGTIPGKCASAVTLLFTNTISHAVHTQLDTLSREIEQLVRSFVSVLYRTDSVSQSPSPLSPQDDDEEDEDDDSDIGGSGERIVVRLRDFYCSRDSAKARAVVAALQSRRPPTGAERESFGKMLKADGVEVAGDAIAHMAGESLFGSLGHAVYGTEDAAPIARLISSLELLANPHTFSRLFPGGFGHLQRYVAHKLFSIILDNGDNNNNNTNNNNTNNNSDINNNNGIDSWKLDMDNEEDCEMADVGAPEGMAMALLLGFSACMGATIVLYTPYIVKPVVVEPASTSKQSSIAAAMRRAMGGIANADSSLAAYGATNTIAIAFVNGAHNEYRPLEAALFTGDMADAAIIDDDNSCGSSSSDRIKKHCDYPVLPPQPISTSASTTTTQHQQQQKSRIAISSITCSTVKSLADLCIESIAQRISQFPAETPQDLPEELAGKVLTRVIAGGRCDGVGFDVILMRLLQGGCVSTLDLADSSSYITRQTLVTVGRACPELTRLSLANCGDLTSETAAVVVASCHALEDLNLRKCGRVCDSLLKLLAANCPRLRALDVSHCTRITSRGLECLWRCADLESLAIAGCSEVTDAGVAGFARLAVFDALGCERLTDATLRALATGSADTLRVLRCSSKLFSDEAAAALIAAAPSLEVVDVSNSAQVGPRALRAALEHRGMNIQKLSFAGCATITDASFPPMGPEDVTATVMQQQPPPPSVLQWGMCTSEMMFAATANLSSLSVAGTQITDAALLWVGTHCPQLVALNVAGCGGVSDAGLCGAISRLPLLAALNASKCPKLTDAPFCDLGKRAGARLRQVAFSSDPGVSDLTMTTLSLHCPNLRELDCSYCHRVSDESVARIVTGCHSLEVLVVDDCPLVSDRSLAALAAAPSRGTLRVLKAAFLPNLTGAGLACLAACCCPALDYLNISYCQNVSPLDVGALLVRGRCALRTLECKGLAAPATQQQQVQLRAMAMAAEPCAESRLRSVNFSWARAPFVNDFFVLLAKVCCGGLESVDLSRCDELSDETVKQIAGRCSKLKRINLAGCPLVQGATIKFLVLSGIMVLS